MARLRSIPAIVSRRNQFGPADELVEDALPFLPDQFKHEHFKAWLVRYTETVIKSVASDFGVAAQRGIEQAADLLCDPAFYATRRKRHATSRKKAAEERAQQAWERAQREACPTQEQLEEQVKHFESRRAYYQAQADSMEVKLHALRATSPQPLSAAPRRVQ
jgi:hypothetical protein